MWSHVNNAINATFDVWLWPFQGLSPVWQIVALSLPVTAISLLIFRFTSNQEGIRAEKNKIKAYMLEMRLFRDDLGVALHAQRHILGHTIKYMRYAIVPMLFMVLPFILILIQVESRFAFRGLEAGEKAIFVVTMDSSVALDNQEFALKLPDGLTRETPPLRIEETGEIFWRIRAESPGDYSAKVENNRQSVEKRILVNEDVTHLATSLYRTKDLRTLGYPAEPALSDNQPVASVEVSYPRARAEYAGLSSASWLLFLFTIVFGFTLRGVFRVTF